MPRCKKPVDAKFIAFLFEKREEKEEKQMDKSCKFRVIPSGLSEEAKQRASYANRIYCEACAENGIKICSWETSSAWQEYVEGKIGESQLVTRAREDVRNLTETFKKYAVIRKDESAGAKAGEDVIRKERAKQAGRIYRKTCTDSGMNNCFFNNFSTWNDYVHGKLDEGEFQAKVEAEVEEMARKAPEE